MLANIRIVMIETSHPGNIGAAARAMMNMELSDLCLVRPRVFPSSEAVARASGANGVLTNAKLCDTLDQAIADCQIVVGASARDRSVAWPELTARACAENLWPQAQHSRIALVFGREHSGLSNDELDRCQYLLRIPCNPRFSSLNVAAAIQVVAYEFYQIAMADASMRSLSGVEANAGFGFAQPAWEAAQLADYDQRLEGSTYQDAEQRLEVATDTLANGEEMASFFAHLRETLFAIGFFHASKSGPSLMRRLRRLFHRARMEKKEIHMLRGILSQMQIRLNSLQAKQPDAGSNPSKE